MSGFMVMGLVSGWSLTNLSNSESFLVVHASLSQDECQWEGYCEVFGHVRSVFDLSWTLPVGADFLVSCSLLGPPAVKKTHAKGYCGSWPGWPVSVSVFHLTWTFGLIWLRHLLFLKSSIHVSWIGFINNNFKALGYSPQKSSYP